MEVANKKTMNVRNQVKNKNRINYNKFNRTLPQQT